jgi:hypothetical protein
MTTEGWFVAISYGLVLSIIIFGQLKAFGVL